MVDLPAVSDGVLDLSRPRRLHVLNIGGAGMSAVATLLAQMGHHVSGHDPATDTPFLDPLRALGVEVRAGIEPQLPEGVDAIVVSTATPAAHQDLVAAATASIPVVHRAAALAAICARRPVAAVAGTHGKTTTSALLATILEGAGAAPGWVVGARVAGLGASASWGGAGPLVVEADESDGTFLSLGAQSAIVTNVEPDHLEHWGGEAQLRDAFSAFVAAVPGPAVLCIDDPGSSALAAAATHPVTYGLSDGADYHVSGVAARGVGVRFRITHGDEAVDVEVPGAPGVHNARNAAGALALADQLGTSLRDAAAALATFRGVARRFEVRGDVGGITFVDSYDHLPTEVSAALEAARAGGWRRVVCCFQPHRYSRTEALWPTFADCFTAADILVVTEIYPAGEAARPGVSGKLVVDAVLDAHPWCHVVWLPTLEDVERYLLGTLRPGDLCITLGAGDLTSIPDDLVAAVAARAT